MDKSFRIGVLYLDINFFRRAFPDGFDKGYFCRCCHPDWLEKLKSSLSLPEQYHLEYFSMRDEFGPICSALISSDEFPEIELGAGPEYPSLQAKFERTFVENEDGSITPITKINKLWVDGVSKK